MVCNSDVVCKGRFRVEQSLAHTHAHAVARVYTAHYEHFLSSFCIRPLDNKSVLHNGDDVICAGFQTIRGCHSRHVVFAFKTEAGKRVRKVFNMVEL